MAIVGRMTKQPVEVLDYDLDFTSWVPAGDSLLTATSAVTPSGLTLGTTTIFATSWVKVRLSGGTDSTRYKVETNVTTTNGLVKQAEFYVSVKEV